MNYIGYKLPTFWEYNSVEIIHQRVSVRCAPNAHVFVFIFILEISCQFLATLYTSIGFILPTIEGYMLVGEFLPHGPTVRGPIVHPEKMDSWALSLSTIQFAVHF